jgi:Family of unknown function (DUF6263)
MVVTSTTGAILEVDGMTRIMAKMLNGLPQNPAAAALTDEFRNAFNDKSMRGVLGQSQTQFPDGALKAGASWDRQVSITNPITGLTTTLGTFTLQGIETNGQASTARISAKLSMKHEAPSALPLP